MKFVFVVASAALAGTATAKNVRGHHVVGARPRAIEFHGIQGVDLDAVKPPDHETAFDTMREQAHLIELGEAQRFAKQLAATKRVEKEFLNSDLHKQALTMKLFNVQD